MSKENIRYMREVMRRAKNLDMRKFQSSEDIACSIKELHTCGNRACFAGYLALSPRFQKSGGAVCEYSGQPKKDGKFVEDIVADFLGISALLSHAIVYRAIVYDGEGLNLEKYVGEAWAAWKPEHLIKILNGILKGELK